MTKQRQWRYAALIMLALVAALFAWKWSAWRAQAVVDAGYGARITCSCRYVEGRTADSCADDTHGIATVSITDLPEEKAVRATVPLMADRTARFRPGWGCLLDTP